MGRLEDGIGIGNGNGNELYVDLMCRKT